MKHSTYPRTTKLRLIFIAALLLSFYLMFSRSLCCDESATALYVHKFNYKDIFEGIPAEYNPPLFYLLSKFSYLNLGLGMIGIRLIPVINYLLAVVIFYQLILRFASDSRIANLATFIFAFLPINIFYSYQARAYSTMLMACIAITFFYHQIWTQERKRFLNLTFYVIFLTFGVYCHYFVGVWAVLIFIGGSIVLFNQADVRSRYSVYSSILAANILAFAICFPELLRAFGHLNEVANLDFAQGKFSWVARAAFNAYGLFFGEIFKPSGWRLGIVLVSIISLLTISFGLNIKTLPGRFWLAFVILLVGLGATSYLKVSRPMYGIFLTIPISYLLSVLIIKSSGWQKKIGVSGLIVSFAVVIVTLLGGNVNSYFAPAYSIQYKKIYSKWSQHGDEKSVLIISPEWNRSIWEYYALKSKYSQIIFFNAHQKGDLSFPKIADEIDSVTLIMEGDTQARLLDQYLKGKYAKCDVLEIETYTRFLAGDEGMVYQIVKYYK